MVKWVISNANVKENSPLEPIELLVIFMWWEAHNGGNY